MIIIESKRKQIENIRKKYPDAIIHDVTSHATDAFVKFSPFYPHGGIPVPFSGNITAMSVESIWQGLKDYDSVGIDISVFKNDTMKDLKRTMRKYGSMKGHKKGVAGSEHLGYIEARKQIYLPAYKWVLEHRLRFLVEKLKEESAEHTVVLLDYNTNPDVEDRSSPLSHASLIKAYIEGTYLDCGSEGETSETKAPEVQYDFSKGDKVNHPTFGEGTIKAVSPGRLTVSFKRVGEKVLATKFCKLERMKENN